MAALSSAEDKLTGIRGSVDEAGAKVRALEEKIAAKIRGYREE
jgi:hypothetical protein